MSEQTQVQEKQNNSLTEKYIGEFTKAEVSTIKHTLAAGTTNEQFQLFLQTCVNSGLNPFLNHIYAITYGGKMSIQVSVEGIAYLARQKKSYLGYDVQLVCENDEFKISREGETFTIKQHDIGFPRGQIVGAYAIAYKEGAKDHVVIMDRSEWEAQKKGKNSAIWNTYEGDMVKKHILKRALKAQFGIDINDEQAIGSDEEPAAPVRKEVSQEPETIIQTGEDETQDVRKLIGAKRNDVLKLQNSKGMTDEDFEIFVRDQFGKEPSELNLQQLTGLYKLLLAYTPPAPVQEEPEEASAPEEPKQEKKSAMDDAFDLFTASN